MASPRRFTSAFAVLALSLGTATFAWAQSVALPLPRLLTIMPMGGQVGSEFEVNVSGENIGSGQELLFSDSRIVASPKLGKDQKPEAGKFLVKIAADAPQGLYEARLKTRLGLSSPRAFTVGKLPEVVRQIPNHSMQTAMAIVPNTICNASTTEKSVDYYFFEAAKGKRLAIECAAVGIDSKLSPVVMVADSAGSDLVVNRTNGWIDFTAPAEGKYFVKIHGLTFQGGTSCFYRLSMRAAAEGEAVERHPATRSVGSFSWRGVRGLPEKAPKFAAVASGEERPAPVKISLPCEISGRFYPAGRVDRFEFEAKKGEVWWAELASERLGLNTNAFILVQKVARESGEEKLVDVVELNDIAPPITPQKGLYSYDGPPYDAGSSDPLGKIEIKEDGFYRVQVRDLFGNAKADSGHRYTLVLRRAVPDFEVVAWGLHMELRNADRSMLSKPMTLRAGTTVALEVAVVRKDGFEGEVQVVAEGLPPGASVWGKVPARQNRGMVLVTAAEDAPEGFCNTRFLAKASVDGSEVVREVSLASMAWPVESFMTAQPSAMKPRLIVDSPVSVTRGELAPVTIRPEGQTVREAIQGEKVTVPFQVKWRSEFSGTALKLKAVWDGGTNARVSMDVPMKGEKAQAVIDLSALKTEPGEYTIAFYGPGVVKYRYHPEALEEAKALHNEAEQKAAALGEESKRLSEELKGASAETKASLEQSLKDLTGKVKAAEAAKTDAQQKMKKAEEAAAPKDTADIIWAEPFRLIVKAPEKK